jgi:photosystem II stability/assembly factor-like uncharacterized protein
MRRHLAATVLIFVACSPGADLFISVTIDSGVGVDQLRFSVRTSTTDLLRPIALPDPRHGNFSSAQSLRVNVPNSLNGEAVIVEVDGLEHGALVSSDLEQATIVAGQEVVVNAELHPREPDDLVCTPPGTSGWCWQNPLPQGNALEGVWGSSVDDVWAVGAVGTVLHWNGSKWSPVPTSAPSPIDLHAVWGTDASNAWAVGDSGTILRWDGTAWNYSSVGGSTGIPNLQAVWGTTTDDVWAVGETPVTGGVVGAVFHLSANAGWAEVPIPTGTPGLTGVWTSDPNQVWIVGEAGTLLEGTGGPLQASTIDGQTVSLSAVWGSSSMDVWAVGNGVVDHFTNGTWNTGFSSNFLAVGGSGVGDIWTVGPSAQIQHFDGSTWSKVPAPIGTTESLSSVWAASPTNAWAVGDFGTMLHWDGSRWSRRSVGTTNDLSGIWVYNTVVAWAVGANGTVDYWNGASWSVDTVGSSTLRAAWGSAPDDLWTVGDSGTAFHWDGTDWTGGFIPGQAALVGLWGAASNAVWAVGQAKSGPTGSILFWDGRSWAGQTVTGLPACAMSFNGIWGSGPNQVWAVGDCGFIAQLSACSWTSSPSSSFATTLAAVTGSSATQAYAAGLGLGTNAPPLVQWNGFSWSADDSSVVPQTAELNGVWQSSPTEVWAVGTGGAIYVWDGQSWSVQPSGTATTLSAVSGNGSDVWAVGAGGAILRYRGP